MKKKQSKRPPGPKRPVGRPTELEVKIDDTPENVARAAFGMKRKRQGDTAQKQRRSR